MKPVSVRFQCFGPYMAEQFIDFQALEKNGLFLICGETGAGKTTILDAMCYALYGRSSGGLRGDLSVMRCKLAEKNDETLVEFIFDSNGKRYKFVRSLKYGRKNLNDTHNCLVLEGEEYVPIFENPKATVVNKKAEELIGLTYDQFRQVIILPQGQFEKLLVSNSEEKEKILVSLFHADRWQRIAEEIYRRVAERDTGLKQEKLQISAKLKEYACENLAQLEEKREEKRLHRDALTEQSATAQQKIAIQKEAYETALLENQGFEVLLRREKEYDALRKQTDYFEQEASILQSADAAEAIRPHFTAWQDAKSRKNRAEGQLVQKEDKHRKAKLAWMQAQAQLDTQEAARPEQEQRKRKLTLLENAREVYRTLEEKRQAVNAAESVLKKAQTAKLRAEMDFSRRDEAWQAAVLAQDRAMEDYRQAQRTYLQGIGSVLAERLAEGQPCPVCGSMEHPTPARKAEGHITEQQLDAFTQKMNEANDAATAARKARTAGEAAKNDAVSAYNQAKQAQAVAQTDYENALAQKMEGIDTSLQLEAAITALSQKVEAYARADVRLAKAMQDAEGDLKASQAELGTAGEDLTAAQTVCAAALAQWQEALAEAGFETENQFHASDMKPEEKQKRTAALLRFRGDKSRAEQLLEEQKALLAGKTAPDLAAVKRELQASEDAYKSMSAQLVLAENTLKAIEADGKNLAKRIAAHDAARVKTDADLDFANRLRGRSGVSLQRYVLGVMLTAITAEANRLLAGVYSGRYRLYRTDEIAGSARKGGLELEVYDSHNNQRRSVTTLSGGEKFLVALSLAIGLSTVVQAQGSGIRLEAMFIDEGFGSLDREAVNDALEVLQGIRQSASLVGIISHVEALAETIPAKIEIKKGKNGSNCVIHC